MSAPQLVFLHGSAAADDLTRWRLSMARLLREAELGEPDRDDPVWTEIRYSDLLDPATTVERSDWPSAPSITARAQKSFARRADRVSRAATQAKNGAFAKLSQKSIEKKLVGSLNVWRDVRTFQEDQVRQQAVIARVLAEMPRGDVILVAHSLGSVVALSMLRYLTDDTRVRLLLTLGSPAGAPYMQKMTNLVGLKNGAPFPYDRVNVWINVVDTKDPVTTGRCLRPLYPQAVDHYVQNRMKGDGAFTVHKLYEYLRHESLADVFAAAELPQIAPPATTDDRLTTEQAVVVSYVHLLTMASDKGKPHRRATLVTDDIVADLVTGDEQNIRRIDAIETVRTWARGASPIDRLAVLFTCAMTNPFVPQEPGCSAADFAGAMAKLAELLRIDAAVATRLLRLRVEVREALGQEPAAPAGREVMEAEQALGFVRAGNRRSPLGAVVLEHRLERVLAGDVDSSMLLSRFQHLGRSGDAWLTRPDVVAAGLREAAVLLRLARGASEDIFARLTVAAEGVIGVYERAHERCAAVSTPRSRNSVGPALHLRKAEELQERVKNHLAKATDKRMAYLPEED